MFICMSPLGPPAAGFYHGGTGNVYTTVYPPFCTIEVYANHSPVFFSHAWTNIRKYLIENGIQYIFINWLLLISESQLICLF